MKERPILFSAPMVRALLDGSKTQTRRVAKLTCAGHVKEPGGHRRWHPADFDSRFACPYGQPGDRLWVREAWARDDEDGMLMYRADVGSGNDADDWERNRLDGVSRFRWRPSIHMPRTASRITLEITGVRVERLQDISERDALAEGIVRLLDGGFGLAGSTHYHHTDPCESYWSLWEHINGPGSVETNPWVWVMDFRRVEGLAA
jgi:hypothetical protein